MLASMGMAGSGTVVSLQSGAARPLAAMLAGVLALTSRPALAEAPREPVKAAIVPLVVDGEMIDADRELLARELVEGLERGRFSMLTPDEPGAEACDDPRCWKAYARAQGVTHVVRATIKVVERDYDIEVELVDGRTGETVARSRESCEICGVADAGALLETAAATLRTKLEALTQSPATVAVVSAPSGAIVAIDGEVIGTTPLEREVITGKHVLRVSKDGYITVEREVTFVDGVAESLQFSLEKTPSRLPPRPWGWVTLGTGLAGLGTAAAFAAIRDRPYRLGNACSGSAVDADGDCRSLWNTEWHVLGFGIAGAALTTLGVAILLNSERKRGASARRGVAHIHPHGVGVRGRF